jgi:ethanolamine utilization protein EutN
MILGKVTGAVWGAKQSENLQGFKIVEVRPVRFPEKESKKEFEADISDEYLEDSVILAVDRIGAGVGELVLIAIGSRVRDIIAGDECPTKHCVIAIVDRAQLTL